ncbi:hypothetical protein D6774_01855 [Candidatus Woesearchaeota archaeon]|nr:MAG: hypothetical protein D6774_01855 [Candidatus Woesearchaeota archaeon]
MSLLYLFAKRFVIGETREEALQHAHTLNEQGIGVIFNVLGEHVKHSSEIAEYIKEYQTLIKQLKGINAQVSLKLSQFGQGISEDLCIANVTEVLNVAKKHNVFVWFDMEDSSTLTSTLEVAKRLSKKYAIGVVLQCYLRNSHHIARSITTPVRLVKGAYKESPRMVFTDKRKTNERYAQMMEYFIAKNHPCVIATHDEKLIALGEKLIKKYRRSNVDFAFLLGVKPQLQKKLVGKGYRVYVYAPYGKAWFAYYWRRMRERKENFIFALKSIFSWH